MAAVINALARLPQRRLPAREASILLAHTPRRASDHAEVFALADVLASANQGAPANEDEVWMISYMDIMTVLLTLFVLLLAVAKTTPDAVVPVSHAGVAHKSVAKPVTHVAATARTGSVRTSTVAKQVVNPVAVSDKLNSASDCCVRSFPETASRMLTAGQAREQLPRFGVTEANGPLSDPLTLALGSRSLRCLPSCVPAGVSRRERGLYFLNPLNVYPHMSLSPLRIAGDAARLATTTSSVTATAATPLAAATITAATAAATTMTATVSAAIDPAIANPKSAAAASARDQLLARLRASPLGQRIETTVDQDNVSLEISDNVLFDTGSATLKARGRAVLDELAGLLTAQNYTVSIEGHSDNVPFHNAAFASNWELSATRATHVTRYLIAQGIAAGRLRAIGYADTHPRADNNSAAGRARNRRVSLVLHLPLSTASTADH